MSIIEDFGAIIIKNEYINSAKQKNWAIQHCNNEWVLQIDSDEELNKDAESIIRRAISSVGKNVHCYKMPRKNFVLGKLVKYGGFYPDWQFRLFRKKYGRWLDKEVHSKVIVPGEINVLNTPIIHHGMPNISKQLANLDRYTKYEANQLSKIGKKFSYIKWLAGPIYIFIKRYFMLMGFRDGWRGLFLSIYTAFYVFVSHAKLLEKQIFKSKSIKL